MNGDDPASKGFDDPPALVIEPEWLIDCGPDCTVGLTIDDGCFIVLLPRKDGWVKTKWIPKRVAEKMATLLTDARLKP